MSNSTVHKYVLNRPGEFTTLDLPQGSKILSFDQQGRSLVVWVLIDVDASTRCTARLLVFGTGWIMTDVPSTFLGTVQTETGAVGSLVWHCFYEFLEASA